MSPNSSFSYSFYLFFHQAFHQSLTEKIESTSVLPRFFCCPPSDRDDKQGQEQEGKIEELELRAPEFKYYFSTSRYQVPRAFYFLCFPTSGGGGGGDTFCK